MNLGFGIILNGITINFACYLFYPWYHGSLTLDVITYTSMKNIVAKIGIRTLFAGTAVLAVLITAAEFHSLKRTLVDDVTLPSSVGNSSLEPKSGYDASAIAEHNLFGVLNVSTPPSEIPESLPETTLKLVLRGVVVSTASDQSNAMIEGSNGSVLNYVTGSEVEAGTTLSAIHNDRIILERRGRLETLFFPQETQASQNFAPSSTAAIQNSARAVASRVEQPIPQQAPPARGANPQQNSNSQQQPRPGNQASLLDRLNQLRGNNQSL